MTDQLEPLPPYPGTTGNLPTYASLFPNVTPETFKIPTEAEQTKIIEDANKTNKRDAVDIGVTVFNTFSKKDDTDDGEVYGFLRIGIKRPLGILTPYVAYQSPKPKAPWTDISAGIEMIYDDEKSSGTAPKVYHYVKKAIPESDWAFDIKVDHLGREDASFVGTLTTVSGTVRWEGSFVTKAPVEVLVTSKPSEQPEDIEGSAEELVGFTPYAGQDEGDIKKGQDAAQVYGDAMMGRISMHALDPETKKTLLPQLDELNGEEKQLLKDNPDFFRRWAIHDLAERLKKEKMLSDELRKHILFKKHWFLKMMTENTKSTTGDNAFIKYWGSRTAENEKETEKLRGQYLDVTSRCYNAGFLHKCTRLKIYCQDDRSAIYWFKLLEAYLLSDEKVDELRYNSNHQHVSKDAITVQSEILHWGQKMTLLRNAVKNVDERRKLDVGNVMTTLNGHITDHAAQYQQIIDNDLAGHLDAYIKEMDGSPEAKKWKEMLEKRMKESSEVANHQRELAASLAFRISSDSSEIGEWIRRRKALTGPPGIVQTGAFRPTFEHIIQEMRNEEFSLLFEKDPDKILAMTPDEICNRWGFQAMIAAELEAELASGERPPPGPKPSFGQRMKNGAKWVWQKAKDKSKSPKFWCSLVKNVLHYASALVMVYQLKTNWGNMKAAEVGMLISYLTAFGVNQLGNALKSGLRSIWVRLNPGWWQAKIGSVVGWLSNAAVEKNASRWARFGYALVGNLKNTLRLVGLAGLCFSLVVCYNEMNKTRDGLETDAEQKRLIFARIQFALTLIETVVITFEIIFEMLGMVTAGAFCGALGAVLGTVGFVVAIVYILVAMPNPDDEAKKFLRAFAKPVGSYDEGQSADPADEPGVQLTTEKKNQ
ncbi:hypothetical protein PFICI_10689 [Pestalotiopsis fici W106-1]|uniref:Uncharacterized protein n=1 Tax=Pestalotiopsis fici (strain W106-1 / CGMCC3.15140) TaxID=1229662 RepID=W3WZR4_PESFW|nr:uncharacterized protein PFICI_10689 [Pestalotiopsis fici W106-1]ETS78627.1 hypothetical protein PFICI_10689 [Pestalotiopsis fici W106-1]